MPPLNSIAVEEIAIDSSGRLLVRPEAADSSFQFIYRAANGLRWEAGVSAFVAAEPERWEPQELLTHIVRTVREELGGVLHLTEQTRWHNVSEQQRIELRGAFEGEAGAV